MSAVLVAVAVPLNETVEPAPPAIDPEILHVGVAEAAARISTMLRLYRSVVGAVSLTVTLVPLEAIAPGHQLNPVRVSQWG